MGGENFAGGGNLHSKENAGLGPGNSLHTHGTFLLAGSFLCGKIRFGVWVF